VVEQLCTSIKPWIHSPIMPKKKMEVPEWGSEMVLSRSTGIQKSAFLVPCIHEEIDPFLIYDRQTSVHGLLLGWNHSKEPNSKYSPASTSTRKFQRGSKRVLGLRNRGGQIWDQ
jgi:hypothetical protein